MQLLNFDLPRKQLRVLGSEEDFNPEEFMSEMINSVGISTSIGKDRKLVKRDIENIVFYLQKLETHIPELVSVQGGTRLVWRSRFEVINLFN